MEIINHRKSLWAEISVVYIVGQESTKRQISKYYSDRNNTYTHHE